MDVIQPWHVLALLIFCGVSIVIIALGVALGNAISGRRRR